MSKRLHRFTNFNIRLFYFIGFYNPRPLFRCTALIIRNDNKREVAGLNWQPLFNLAFFSNNKTLISYFRAINPNLA